MFEAGKVGGTNFMSFDEIGFDFRNRGSVLVEGLNMDNLTSSNSNGSGKSVLFVELPPFALYGKTLRGLKYDEVIKIGKDTCSVFFEFKKNEDEYRVERSRGKNASLSLFKNGVDETTLDMNETQKKIDEVIPYNLFVNGICFSGSVFESFVLASDSSKKEIMSDMFGLSMFEGARKLVVSKHSGLKDDLLRVITKIEQIDEDIELLENQKKSLDDMIKDFKEDELKEKQELEKRLTSDLSGLEEDVKDLREKKDDLTEKKDKLLQLKHKYDLSKSKQESVCSELENKKKEIEDLKTEGRCPTCGQVISGEYKMDEVASLDEKLKGAKEQFEEDVESVEKIESAVEGIRRETAKDIEMLGKKLHNLESVKEEKEKVQKFVLEKTHELEKYKVELSGIDKDIKNKKTNKNNKQKEVFGIESNIGVYEFWKEGFSSRGISNFILELYLPTLNNLINEYVDYMFDESLHIEFKPFEILKNGTRKEKWSVDIEGWIESYTGCSAGERRRIDLVIMLAMNRMLRSRLGGSNLLIIDEALDPLDDKGIERVLELLGDKMFDVESFFVVTHEHDLGEFFDKRIVVKKEHGVSSISNEVD